MEKCMKTKYSQSFVICVKIFFIIEGYLVVNFCVDWIDLFPQQCFPLESTEGVCPPLICPNPLEVEGVVASPGCGGRPWANYLQPAQQKSCLGSDPHH